MKSQHEGAQTPQLHHPETAAGSKYNTTSGLSPHEQLERPAEFQPHHKTRPDSPVPTLQRPCDRSQKWSGMLSLPLHWSWGPIHPCRDVQGKPRCFSQRQRRSDFPEETRVVDCPASPGKECQHPCRTSRGGWYLLDSGGEPGAL